MDKGFSIAVASGTFKGVFAHGVLAAIESSDLAVNAYACASSSVISSTLSAIGAAQVVGLKYWQDALALAKESQQDMSHVVLQSIQIYGPLIKKEIFSPDRSRVLIYVSAVNNEVAAELTQGEGARKLGRRLLLDAFKGEASWVRENLDKTCFDSQPEGNDLPLTNDNFDAVVYASTRMLHAWKQPAWIDGKPYVDASYTCMCPAFELCELGYREVLAVGTEPGPLYADMFKTRVIEAGTVGATKLHTILPDYDLKAVGVDYTDASEEGLDTAFQHGYEKGLAFVTAYKKEGDHGARGN